MIEHFALAHRNSGAGWVIMSTDGRLWEADRVGASLPLDVMLGEALALLGQYPGADFTFSTRLAREVWAAPFDQQSDRVSLDRELGRATVSVLVPIGAGQWRLLHREPGGAFRHLDSFEAADVIEFLRDWPENTETIDKGLAGPVEVWFRRQWNAETVLKPRTFAAGET